MHKAGPAVQRYGAVRLPMHRLVSSAKIAVRASCRCRQRKKGLVHLKSAGPADSSADLSHRKPSQSEEHTSELQSRQYLVCRLLLEKKKPCTKIQVRNTVTITMVN